MANPEQLIILQRGTRIWNDWREDNPDVMIDLSGAQLSGENLTRINLSEANLASAILQGASLEWADLSFAFLEYSDLTSAHLLRANLTNTQLANANLSQANLFGANLTRTDLSHANLSQAILIHTIFSETKLLKTNLSAFFDNTQFGNVDISEAIDLGNAKHRGPSSIGIDTIYRSKGKIHKDFLRSAGVPELLIEYIPDLITGMEPIQFYSCFISYSSLDEEFARKIYEDLRSKGINVWIAPEDLKIGSEFEKEIRKEIRVRDKLILVISKDSIVSEWVEYETKQAMKEELRRNEGLPDEEPITPILFPVTIDDEIFKTDAQWAWALKDSRHIGDFRDWESKEKYQRAFDRILRDLQQSVEKLM